MVNEEILGGLKSALERGQSMKNAVLSLLNAGYKKEEIEEAARALSEPMHIESPPQVPTPPKNSENKTSIFKKLIPEKKPSPKQESKLQEKSPTEIKPKDVQKVSDYTEKKPNEKTKIIFLISLLSILVIFLIFLFVFKNDITLFLSNIFS